MRRKFAGNLYYLALRATVLEIADTEDLADDTRLGRLLDMHEVRRLLVESRGRGRDLTERVWALFWLEHWLRTCHA